MYLARSKLTGTLIRGKQDNPEKPLESYYPFKDYYLVGNFYIVYRFLGSCVKNLVLI